MRGIVASHPESPGDPIKGMEAIYNISKLPDPPLRVFLGKDSIEMFKQRSAIATDLANQSEQWSVDLNI